MRRNILDINFMNGIDISDRMISDINIFHMDIYDIDFDIFQDSL
jgi:hypothetical protein